MVLFISEEDRERTLEDHNLTLRAIMFFLNESDYNWRQTAEYTNLSERERNYIGIFRKEIDNIRQFVLMAIDKGRVAE